VVIPEGTFISALPPAPTTMYFDAAEAVFNAVVKALLPGLGDHAFAGHFGTNMGLLFTGSVETSPTTHVPRPTGEDTPGADHTHGVPLTARTPQGARIFIAPLFCLGGFGACSDADGEGFISMSQQNLMDMAVEAIEDDFPLMVLRKEFVQDSAGPGRFRGGPGVIWDRVVTGPAEVRPMLLHLRILPWSARGGEEGRPGGAWVGSAAAASHWMDPFHLPVEAGRSPADFYRSENIHPLAGTYDPRTGDATGPGEGQWVFGLGQVDADPGTLFRVVTPSGGGFGDPFERDPAAVLKDVRDGFVSVEGAEVDYGVVLVGDATRDPQGLRVDEAATAARRNGRGQGP
jgi:N-methylhydantoinase B